MSRVSHLLMAASRRWSKLGDMRVGAEFAALPKRTKAAFLLASLIIWQTRLEVSLSGEILGKAVAGEDEVDVPVVMEDFWPERDAAAFARASFIMSWRRPVLSWSAGISGKELTALEKPGELNAMDQGEGCGASSIAGLEGLLTVWPSGLQNSQDEELQGERLARVLVTQASTETLKAPWALA